MSLRRWFLVAASMGLAAAVLVGCGIPNDREPHDLEPVPESDTTVQP